MHKFLYMLHIFAPECVCVCVWLTPSWVKSSSDKLIISSLEERWLTEREAVNQQLLAERKAEKNRSPAKKGPRGFLLNKATQISPSAWSTLGFIYLFSTLLVSTRPIYKNKYEEWKTPSCIYRSELLRDFNAYEQVSLAWNHWHKIKAFMLHIAVLWTTWMHRAQLVCTPAHTIIFASSQCRI